MTIKIFAIGKGAWGVPFYSCAPFPAKLETWLRLVGLDYEPVNQFTPRGSPKGKMPWMDDGGVVMGDSELIIDFLSEKHGVGLDGNLTPEQVGLSRAFRALLEEHYHQIWEWWTFIGPTQEEISAEVFAPFPPVLKQIGRTMLRRGLRKQLHARGIGRHSPEEIFEMGIHDLDAMSSFLGDKPYFLGDQPTTLDCTAFAFIALTLAQPVVTRAHEHAHTLPNLAAYVERMTERAFGTPGSKDNGASIAA